MHVKLSDTAVSGKDTHGHLIFSGDSFKHPEEIRNWDTKATVVKEGLKYLQYLCPIYHPCKMLSLASGRMRPRTHKGHSVLTIPSKQLQVLRK